MPKDNRPLDEILADNARLSQGITDSIDADRAEAAQGPSYALQTEFTPAPEVTADAPVPAAEMDPLVGRQQAEISAWDGKDGKAPVELPDLVYLFSPAVFLGKKLGDLGFHLDSNNLPAIDHREFDLVARQDHLPSFLMGFDREQAREMVDPSYNTFVAGLGRPGARDAERAKFRKDGYAPTMPDIMAIAEAYDLDSKYWSKLADARSPEDLQALATQYKLRNDREFEIAQSMDGVDGFIARAGVNMLDPTFLMAGGGVGFVAKQTRLSLVAANAFGTSTAGRVAAGALQAAGENIAADAPLELYRKANDPTYSWDQYALAVGGSAAFGVVLGGLGGAVRPKEAEAFEQALSRSIYQLGQEGTGDAGARQLNEVIRYTDDSYLDVDAEAPERQRFTFGTPLARLQRSESSTVRGIASLLSWNPWTKGGGQRLTAWEAKRRIVDTAAVHARPAVQAAKQFFAERGDLAVTGGMSTQQIDEFFSMVGHHAEMVRTGQEQFYNTNPHVVAAFEALDAGTADTLNYVRGRGYVTGREAPPPPPKPKEKPTAPEDPNSGPTEAAESVPEAVVPEAPQAPEVAPDPIPETRWQLKDNDGTVLGEFEDAAEARKALLKMTAGRKPGDPSYAIGRVAVDGTEPKPSYFGRKSFRGADRTVPMDEPKDMGEPTTKYSRETGEHTVTYPDGTTAVIYRDNVTKDWNIVEPEGYKRVAQSQPGYVQTLLGTTKAEALENLPAKLKEFEDIRVSERSTPVDTTVEMESEYTYAQALEEANALPAGEVLPREGRNAMQTMAGAERQGEVYLQDLEAYLKTAPSLGSNIATQAGGALLGGAGGAVAADESLPDEVRVAGAILGALIGGYAGNRVVARRLSTWARDMPTAGFMVGPNAQGVDLNKLARAKKLEAKGVDRDTIWEKTGWGRMPGAGNGWGTEMTDAMYFKELLGVQEVKAGDVLKMRAIFKAYPDLSTTWLQSKAVLSYIDANPGVGAVVMTNGNSMKNAMIGLDVTKPRGEIISSMQHEVQHLIDMLEKRDPGSTGAGGEYAYLTSAGEAMARNGETRLGMTQRERAKTGPWKTLDVPEDHIWMSHEMVQGEAASLTSHLRTMQSDGWFASNVVESDNPGGREFKVNLPSGGEGIDVRLADYSSDGILEVEWDWQSNDWSMDQLDKSLAESGEAFAAVHAVTERMLKEGKDKAYYFSGLTGAHARLQRFLISRRPADNYVAYEMQYKKAGDEDGKMSGRIFGLVKAGEDVEDIMSSRRTGKGEYRIVNVDHADAQADAKIAASRKPVGPVDPDAPEAEVPMSRTGRQLVDEDGYDGAHDFKDVEHERGHMQRSYNEAGFNTLMNRFRDKEGVSALLAGPLHRANEARFAEIGARTGATSHDIANRVARKYIDTVAKLMNQAQKKGGARFQPMHPEYRDAAVDIARQAFNEGDVFPGDIEEAIEMVMDLIAPVKKSTANSNRAKPRIDMMFDPNQDADIMGMFNWNALDNFMSYRSQLAGHAGLLKAGFRSAAELDTAIKSVRDQAEDGTLFADADGNVRTRRQKAVGREANMLEAMRDAILGVPSEALTNAQPWSFWTNQIRRMNFASTMGNVGFLAVSEIGGALTATGPGAIFSRLPAFRKYFAMARSGDPAVRENLYYATDMLMGHGSAQLRSRLTRTNSRYEGVFEALADPDTEFQNRVDTFTRKASNLTARWSGMHAIQEYLRSNIAVDGANFWVRAAAAGKKPLNDKRMLALGVDDDMWSRISAELTRMETFQSPDTGRPVNAWDVGNWQDEEALNVFINAIDRNTRRVVMEGDLGHLPLELRGSPFLQLLTQFMNFPISAYSKHLGFAVNAGALSDTKVAQEVILMSLGGAIGYMARTSLQAAAIRDEEQRNKFAEERLTMAEAYKAAFYYSAHASLMPNAVDTAGAIGKDMGIPGVGPVFSKTRASGLGSDILTGNPTYSKFSRGKKGLTDLVKDGPSQDEVKNAALLMAPLGNHIITQATVNALFELVPDTEVFPDEAPDN
jgi:hypothetical protein